jgi:predicted TIM-barrel fold metal-dependent hydrolase
MTSLGYRVFDADSHYYEPPELFEQYIDPAFRDRTYRLVKNADGSETVYFNGQPYGHVQGLGLKRRVRPGGLREALRRAPDSYDSADEPERPFGWGNTEGEELYAADPDARLALMDHQGIEATLIFPSASTSTQNRMFDDPALTGAHIDAFNRWLSDTWSFNYENRIIAPAMVSLIDAELAVRTLEFALEKGAPAIQLLPGPAVWGTSPVDSIFDTFWGMVNEARLLVAYHAGNSGYLERYSADWGENSDPDGMYGPQAGRSAWQWTMLYRDRPIMDTLAALIYGNLFTRFPNIRVISVENGSVWVPYLLRSMDNMKGMGRHGPWKHGYLEARPSEVFKKHMSVSPHHYGEDIGALIDLLGASQVLFGSDFPHPEGMSDIEDYEAKTAILANSLRHDANDVRQVMRDNGMALVGLSADQSHA